MFLELLILTVIICYLIDLSGIIGSVKWFIWKRICKGIGRPENIRLKPFECSLCMTFWIGLIFLILTAQLSLINVLMVCLLSFLSKNVTGLLRWIQEALVALEERLYDLIQKP